MRHLRRLLPGVATALMALMGDYAHAQALESEHVYAISSQPLSAALKQFATQSGMQILFSESDVAGRQTPGVSGRHTGTDALRLLLLSSDLGVVEAGPNAIVIRRAPAIQKIAWTSNAIAAEREQAGAASIASAEADKPVLEEVVVTGSLIRQSVLPSPINIIDGDSIAEHGITNVSELVNILPANAGSEAQIDQLNQPLTSGTAQFNLRDLGLGSTLVLVNSRRQTLSAVAATDGSTFTDINSLVPLIAIERVEVVKDGAAATYGSDAVAGVVNFITRNSVDRPELKVHSYFMDGASQLDIEGIAGLHIGDGNLVLAASYYNSTRLATYERDFSRAVTFGRPSWHSVSSFGQPGSYFVPSLNRFVPDPNCTNPAFPDSFKNSASDTFCRFDFSDFFDLIPKEHRAQVFTTFNAPLGDDLQLNLEAGYANTHSETTSSPSFPILAVTPVVPATHPDNPFGEAVRFRGRLLGPSYGPSIATFDYNTFRLAAGLEGKLVGSWTWTTGATVSQQEAHYNKPDTIASALTNALNGLGGPGCNAATGTPGVGACQYYNPFGSASLGTGTPNSDALINSLIGYSDLHGRANLFTVDAVATGDVFEYSGGTVAAAAGLQYRRDTFRHDWGDLVNQGELITLGQAPDFSGSQENVSVFGEVKAPFGKHVEAQLSGRYEKYLHSFGNFSPKVALLFTPIDAIALRGSYGKAFRAPSVYQRVAVQAAQPSVNDGGTFVFINTQAFGNPDLRPEKSTSFNVGVTLRPLDKLEFSADYYGFDYKDLIVKENPQPIIDQARADTLAGLTGTPAQLRVQRDINGTLQLVRLNFINASSVKTDGVDVTGRYTLDTSFGAFDFNGAWTHVNKYLIRIAPGSAEIEGAGNVNFNNLGRSLPRDRVQYGVSWKWTQHQLSAFGHYISSYKNDRSGITQTHIKAQNTFDVQYNLNLDSLLGKTTTRFTLGVVNVTNKMPPLAQLNLGFDPIVHDPRGRVIHVGIDQGF